MKSRHIIALSIFSIIVFGGVYISENNSNLHSGFTKILPGDSKEIVIFQLGKPDLETKNCTNISFWVDQEMTSSKCVEEIRYDAYILPKYWTIGFDKNRRAILKYEHVSP